MCNSIQCTGTQNHINYATHKCWTVTHNYTWTHTISPHKCSMRSTKRTHLQHVQMAHVTFAYCSTNTSAHWNSLLQCRLLKSNSIEAWLTMHSLPSSKWVTTHCMVYLLWSSWSLFLFCIVNNVNTPIFILRNNTDLVSPTSWYIVSSAVISLRTALSITSKLFTVHIQALVAGRSSSTPLHQLDTFFMKGSYLKGHIIYTHNLRYLEHNPLNRNVTFPVMVCYRPQIHGTRPAIKEKPNKYMS